MVDAARLAGGGDGVPRPPPQLRADVDSGDQIGGDVVDEITEIAPQHLHPPLESGASLGLEHGSLGNAQGAQLLLADTEFSFDVRATPSAV
jgi:hypothetical protein